VMWYATMASAILFGLIIAAFVFIGLCVAAYVGPAGWIAVAATAFFGTLGFASMIFESPLFSQRIGNVQSDTVTTNTRVWGGFSPEQKREDFRTPKRNGREDDYMTDDGSVGRRQYVDDRMSWGTSPHIPVTPGDVYIGDRRASRARKASAVAPWYDDYDAEKEYE